MSINYPRPPITEAVIEIRLDQPVPKVSLDKVRARALKKYPLSDELSSVGVLFEPEKAAARVKQEWIGYKLTNVDSTDILMLQSQAFSTSRLAPYPGWESFCGNARQEWNEWKREVGYIKVIRIGVRYINRLDIPVENDGFIRVEDYLKLYVQLPNFETAMTGLPIAPKMADFTTQVHMHLSNDQCELTINSSSIPSPLVKHLSLVLDIDVSRQREVPQHDEEIWALIDRIRDYKNHIFEESITEAAREIFLK